MDDSRKEAIIQEYLRCYTFDRYNNLIQFRLIINDLPSSLKQMAMLKFYVCKLQNDDLGRLKHDPEIIEKIVSAGFEDLFSVKSSKATKTKNEKGHKTRARSKASKKRKEKVEEEDISKEQKALKETLEDLDNKLYGLIVPKAGNFLPDFFDMIKLMTLKL